jgi:hypothetical protein
MEMQEMMERLLAEIRADRKADQEKADANRQADRELLIGIMDANAKSMREDNKSGEEKTEAAIHSIRSELEETVQHEMLPVICRPKDAKSPHGADRENRKTTWNYRQ